jgi:hypothetical protein
MIVISFAIIGVDIKYILNNMTDNVPPSFYSAVTAFFVISLAVNTFATALIVYKIIIIHIEVQQLDVQTNGSGIPNLSTLISILVESGLITFAGQLAQSIMYKAATNAFLLVGGSVVMLYVRACRLLNPRHVFIYTYFMTQGISMTAVFVRVAMGISYDNTTLARITISTNLDGQMQLTTFEAKLNPSQTVITKVRRSGSPATE